jgi:hypothetical protein
MQGGTLTRVFIVMYLWAYVLACLCYTPRFEMRLGNQNYTLLVGSVPRVDTAEFAAEKKIGSDTLRSQ